MTNRERNIIKEIYPLACAGGVHAMKVLQNLTTRRRKSPKCKNCGEPIVKLSGKADKKFCTSLCFQIAKRNQGLKPLLSV